MSSLKVVNYNLWHGLNGQGLFKFGDLEPAGRRAKRYAKQVEDLKSLDAGLIFLQEVSPLYSRAPAIAKALGYRWIAQYDQSGIQILGWGIPINLRTGLAILAKPELKLRKTSGLKLSGGPGFGSRFLSFQYTEFRYALLGSIQWGDQRIQVVNTHLHHGPVLKKALTDLLEGLFAKVPSLPREKILEILAQPEKRRSGEVQRLLKYLKAGPKILAGDLNVEEDDKLMSQFSQSGFRDVFLNSGLYSWNASENRENHRITRGLHLPVPTYGSAELEEMLKNYDARKRRIDYILTTEEFEAQEPRLILTEAGREGIVGSDHFGLSVKVHFGKTH